MRRRLLPLLLLICALPVAAQIYKYTDANGNTAYSNQPPDGKASQTVELPPLNSIVRQQPIALPPGQEPSNQATSVAPYSALELTDVPNDAAALRANNGTFTVGVRIEPRLQNGHRLRLLLDGNAYGQPSNVPRLQLVNIDRGEHSLSVQVLDGERVVQQSPTVTFTVQRVHKP